LRYHAVKQTCRQTSVITPPAVPALNIQTCNKTNPNTSKLDVKAKKVNLNQQSIYINGSHVHITPCTTVVCGITQTSSDYHPCRRQPLFICCLMSISEQERNFCHYQQHRSFVIAGRGLAYSGPQH